MIPERPFDQPPPVPPPPFVTDYRGFPAPQDRRPSTAQVVGTAIATVVVLIVAIGFGFLVGALQNNVGPQRWGFLVLIIGGALVGVNVLAFALRRNPRWRGVAMGLWIGLGVTALIEGACFGLSAIY